MDYIKFSLLALLALCKLAGTSGPLIGTLKGIQETETIASDPHCDSGQKGGMWTR